MGINVANEVQLGQIFPNIQIFRNIQRRVKKKLQDFRLYGQVPRSFEHSRKDNGHITSFKQIQGHTTFLISLTRMGLDS